MQLEQLKLEMTAMGMLCENAIAKASHALLNCDVKAAGELPDAQVCSYTAGFSTPI